MADILIRGVPDEVVGALDAKARRAGLSRSEYLRRALVRESDASAAEVTVDDLAAFGQRFSDLGDAEVMREAWS